MNKYYIIIIISLVNINCNNTKIPALFINEKTGEKLQYVFNEMIVLKNINNALDTFLPESRYRKLHNKANEAILRTMPISCEVVTLLGIGQYREEMYKYKDTILLICILKNKITDKIYHAEEGDFSILLIEKNVQPEVILLSTMGTISLSQYGKSKISLNATFNYNLTDAPSRFHTLMESYNGNIDNLLLHINK